VAAKEKNSRNLATTFLLVGAVIFALLLGGCADTYYAAANWKHSPEAKYNTYYAPHYYPYYPWYAYYGGAYFYGNE
jgi:hypothetical protein